MKKLRILAALLALGLLTGCGSLLPKKVEFLQDKVRKFPAVTSKQKELQRQVAQLAKEKAVAVSVAAAKEDASPAVTVPAEECVILTDVLAESTGAPLARPSDPPVQLADNLRNSMAKHDKKVDSFKEDNDENAGKKIEGTGLVQIPYFAWIGLVGLVVFVGWHLAKTALTAASAANPGALIGVGAMNLTGAAASKGIVQLVNGGKRFLSEIETAIEDPALREKVKAAFLNSHKTEQDRDVRSVVDNLTK